MTSSDPPPPDPFFGEVVRRHPDVDVVILPPEPDTAPVPPPRAVDLDAAREEARHVHVVLETVLAGLVARGVYDAADSPHGGVRTWTGSSDAPSGCTYAASVGLGAADGDAARSVLEQVGDLLLANGHDARPVEGRRARLVASDGRCVVEAEARGRHVRVEVRTTALLLDRPDLIRLRQETRGEQP